MSNSQPVSVETQNEWRRLIQQGGQSLAINLTAYQLDLLVSYIEHLVKWNKAYNLTAIHDPLEMIKLHLLDSLSIVTGLAELKGDRYLDVGTGAGLPGLILAIVWPQKVVHLIDTNGKKTRFLTHFKHLHQLENVEIFNQRCEKFSPVKKYDIVLSRAFASLTEMLEGCQKIVTSGGVFVAMKGTYPQTELDAMPTHYSLINCEILQVPGLDAKRHLLTVKKQ